MLGIIIQARLGSTRFPKKVLKPFMDTKVILYLIEQMKRLNIPIVVATTTSSIDDELVSILQENNINVFRGSENDVLLRFIESAKDNSFTEIIRVCSDNPFVDIFYLEELVKIWKSNKTDYLSYSFQGTPTILTHFGVFVEITTLKSLEKVNYIFDNQNFHEHVTNGIYNNPGIFNISLIELPDIFKEFEGIRLTLDTEEDYKNLLEVVKENKSLKELSFNEIAKNILINPSLLEQMKLNSNNNKKS